MIYLDYAAHTPADPRVLARFCEVESSLCGNPNSQHSAGRAAGEALARETDAIAALLGVRSSELIYTSGASESNNTAIKGLVRAAGSEGKHIIATPLAHSSVSACLDVLREEGYEIDLLDVDENGKIDLSQLERLLRKDTVLLTVCAVDSELGAVQPVAEIADILKTFPNCRFHVDATQAAGKMPLIFDGVDTMSLSPHKFYGLGGSGLLFLRRGVKMLPLINGGAGATPYRSGTPSPALAAATKTALELAISEQTARVESVRVQNEKLRRALRAYPKVRINSPADAVPHILNLSVDGVKSTAFQRALDECGVCVSVRSACSQDGQPSRAVLAVTGDRRRALSSWRVSLSHLTSGEELDGFLAAFDRCYQKLAG